MATDPIRRIRSREHETAFDLDVRSALRRLAALPPSPDIPYLTVSLDWRPEGSSPAREALGDVRPSQRRSLPRFVTTSSRPSRQEVEKALREFVNELGPRGEVVDSLTGDIVRLSELLDDVDPATQGIFVVACSAHGVFEELSLGLPIETRATVGPTPALSVLARLDDDHPPYAVLLADQHEATLSFITQATVSESVSVDSTGYPRKQKQGGPNQRRYQNRADERVAAFARGIADETRQALDETGVGMLIIAGDEVMTSALDVALHPTVKERIIATIRLDSTASEQEVIEAMQSLVRQEERDREAAAVTALQDQIGADAEAVSGAERALATLQGGRVDSLIMVDDLVLSGWADFSMGLYGTGEPPAEHPAGGDPANIVPVDLDEELIRLAFESGADVQIVKSASGDSAADGEIPAAGEIARSAPAAALDQFGGVGALLRYSIYQALPDLRSVNTE
jgi:peptide subunit release factor 1 (eRF1)